jgi:hypothetical protein
MSESRIVRLEDVIRVFFDELDPVWLKSMWDEDRENCENMIEIIPLVYLIKTMH